MMLHIKFNSSLSYQCNAEKNGKFQFRFLFDGKTRTTNEPKTVRMALSLSRLLAIF